MSTGGEPDLSLLPEDLQGLARLIPRYAESDDLERTALLESASEDELRDLSTAPQEHWDAINAFLDEHIQAEPGPYQDAAFALDSFAQAAMEAEFELQRRTTN